MLGLNTLFPASEPGFGAAALQFGENLLHANTLSDSLATFIADGGQQPFNHPYITQWRCLKRQPVLRLCRAQPCRPRLFPI
jgi:hypothetical protein